MRSSRGGAGFTLVELLVVIVIISILVALLLPAVNAAREASRRSQCANNLKQLSLGILQYEEQNKTLPAGEIHGGTTHCRPRDQIGMWMNMIFPFIELQVDYDKIDFKANPQHSVAINRTIMQKKYPIFICPTDPYDGLTTSNSMNPDNNLADDVARICHYGGVAGAQPRLLRHFGGTLQTGANMRCNMQEGVLFNDSGVTMAGIRDGASTTAMLCETWGRIWRHEMLPSSANDRPSWATGAAAEPWSNGMNHYAMVFFEIAPNLDHSRPDRVNSFHPGGVQVAFADGAIRFLANTIDFPTYQALATRNGPSAGGAGEVIDPSKF